MGTTGLMQIQKVSDTGVPVGTAEQIRYRTELIQIHDLIRNGTYSDTGVPVGTSELIPKQDLIRNGTY